MTYGRGVVLNSYQIFAILNPGYITSTRLLMNYSTHFENV
jgi:hypothetical protein